MTGNPKIEKIGGLTFRDGLLVSTIDAEKEIAKRGGIDAMLERAVEHNPLLRRQITEQV